MRKTVAVMALATFAAGCDTPTVEQRWLTDVDGHQVGVEKIKDRNSWFASHKPGQGVGSTDSAAHARHIRAIEMAAGCPVDRTSIYHNPYGYSTAAVACNEPNS